MVKVNEIFLSIQGEGVSAGYPTVFVRLTGCNLRCSYCDTAYSYSEGEDMTVDDVVEKVESFGYKRVCLTGGEPLLQEESVKEILKRLQSYEVSIETNGTVDLSKFKLCGNHRFTMDLKTPMSKESKKNFYENFNNLSEKDEIKVVIGNRADYLWALEMIDLYYKKGTITFSPMFGMIEPEKIIEWILEDKRDIRFQIQLHKVIWDPNTKGV